MRTYSFLQNYFSQIKKYSKNIKISNLNARFQKDKRKSVSVAPFVSKILASKERPDLMMFDENFFESVWNECKLVFETISINLT